MLALNGIAFRETWERAPLTGSPYAFHVNSVIFVGMAHKGHPVPGMEVLLFCKFASANLFHRLETLKGKGLSS